MAVSGKNRNGVSPGALRRAVDGVFLAPGDPRREEYAALVGQYPAAALRHILERGDKALLAAAIRSGRFPVELTERIAGEFLTLPVQLRLLIEHPALAIDVPPPRAENSAAEESAASDREDPAEALERRQFEIGIAFPFLRSTVTGMPRTADDAVSPFGTDGFSFYYKKVRGPAPTQADFQHMLIHCLFRHMAVPEGVIRPLWDLACDMACEFIRVEIFRSGGKELQYAVTGTLPEGCDPRSAASIYKGLADLFDDEFPALKKRFTRDDHRYWYERPPRRPGDASPGQGQGGGTGFGGEDRQEELLLAALEDKWRELAEVILPDKKERRRYGLSPGSREEKMLLRQAGKYDFTRYLRRFSILREEMQLDESSFDYIPYHYGLERYGNLPFIEPLEYSESFRIAELVIAIDTSGSCTREIVERFLAETERILMRRENFFRKMNVHIIQCDAIIQEHVCIRSPEDWKRYLKTLTIKGRGGTSFIPVFNLVEKLRDKKELKDLKGLLYFTDGDGAYPRRGPDYEVAFIFPDRETLRPSLPPWITPLCLD